MFLTHDGHEKTSKSRFRFVGVKEWHAVEVGMPLCWMLFSIVDKDSSDPYGKTFIFTRPIDADRFAYDHPDAAFRKLTLFTHSLMTESGAGWESQSIRKLLRGRDPTDGEDHYFFETASGECLDDCGTPIEVPYDEVEIVLDLSADCAVEA